MKQDERGKSFFKWMFTAGDCGALRKFLICFLCIAFVVYMGMATSVNADTSSGGGSEAAASPDVSPQVSPGTTTQTSPNTPVVTNTDVPVSPGTTTQASPGTSTQASPGTSTQASPGTTTQASPGTSTQTSANPFASASPSASTSPKPTAAPTWTYNPNAPVVVATVNPGLISTPTPKPTAKPTPTPKPPVASPTPEVIKTGVVKKVGNINYSILSSEYSGGTVSIKRTADKKSKSVTIPDTVVIKGITYKVTEIAKGAFTGMKQLKNLKIGENVEVIGQSAFESCQKLEFVMIPKNVTEIRSRAFASCKKMHFLVIKSPNLTAIGSKALLGTNDTIKIKVPKKKLKSYKTLAKNGKVSRYATFLTSPKTICYKGVNY